MIISKKSGNNFTPGKKPANSFWKNKWKKLPIKLARTKVNFKFINLNNKSMLT